MKKEGKMIVFTKKNRTVRVPEVDLAKGLTRYNLFQPRCTVAIGAKWSFVAIYGAFGENYPLWGIDSKRSSVLWQTESWALGIENIPGGNFANIRHEVQLYYDGAAVVLFGTGTLASYAESFGPKRGQNVFRFSTDYWMTKQVSEKKAKKGK
jgi:hypothetical protein